MQQTLLQNLYANKQILWLLFVISEKFGINFFYTYINDVVGYMRLWSIPITLF